MEIGYACHAIGNVLERKPFNDGNSSSARKYCHSMFFDLIFPVYMTSCDQERVRLCKGLANSTVLLRC
jgi:hypothetical protein